MSVEIREVLSKKDLRKFILFPFSLYKGNEYWLPPMIFDEWNTLRKDRNPAFESSEARYWLAYKDGRLAGRIAGIINHKAIQKWKTEYGRVGWIDFVDDRDVSSALFDAAETWFKERGLKGSQGPLGFTDLDKEGMLIEGFEELGTLPMIYNHPYYPVHIEALGYKKDVDWLEFEIKVPEEIPEKVLRVNELVLKRSKLHLAKVKSTKELARRYGAKVFQVVNEAYANLYGTVALSDAQIKAYIKTYLGFIDLKYTKVVVDEHDELVAFGIAMPSMSRAMQKSRGRLFPIGWMHILLAMKFPKGLDLYYVAEKPEYRMKGIASLLMTSICESAIKNGIKTAESSGELETNVEVQGLWKLFEKRQHKRRRAYLKIF